MEIYRKIKKCHRYYYYIHTSTIAVVFFHTVQVRELAKYDKRARRGLVGTGKKQLKDGSKHLRSTGTNLLVFQQQESCSADDVLLTSSHMHIELLKEDRNRSHATPASALTARGAI